MKKLILTENEINTCANFNGHESLEFIDLGKNKLKSLTGLKDMPKLTELVLTENEIVSVMELEGVPNL